MVIVSIILVLIVYDRVTNSFNALGTLQANGVLIDGKLQVTTTAVGGGVVIRGIVILGLSTSQSTSNTRISPAHLCIIKN